MPYSGNFMGRTLGTAIFALNERSQPSQRPDANEEPRPANGGSRSANERSRPARNYIIFPIQMDDPHYQPSSPPLSSYSTADIKDRHMMQPDLAEHVQTIWVDAAIFYKQTKNPQHEFIVFSVRDQKNPNLHNFVALDRNVRVRKGLIGFRPWNRKAKDDVNLAEDRFHVSHRGDLPPLLKYCAWEVSGCNSVEHIAFGQGAFTLAQLLVLASTTTQFRPQYSLSQYHCYWFANSIWECITMITNQAVAGRSTARATLKGIQVLTASFRSHVEDILLDYDRKLKEFIDALRCNEMVFREMSNREQQRENEETEARLARMQQEIAEIQNQRNRGPRNNNDH